MAYGNGGQARQNSIRWPANRTEYRLWVKTLTARSWWAGKARYIASLVEKPFRTCPLVLDRTSRPGEYSATVTAVYGSGVLIRDFCVYTREDWTCLYNLRAFRAILFCLSLRIAKIIFGPLPSTVLIAFAASPWQ